MGKNNSKCHESDLGSIGLVITSPEVKTGDYIYGNIYLNVKHQFQAGLLELIIKGKEKIAIVEEKTRYEGHGEDRRTVRYTEYYKAKTDFCCYYFPIHYFNNIILNPGLYQFQFSIYLPPNLPGSFKFHKNDMSCKYDATSKYYLKAHVTKNQRSFSKNDVEIKHKIDLKIKSVSPIYLNPQKHTDKSNITSCCCVNHGESLINAYFSKETYVAGEKLQVNLEIDNTNSTANCQELRTQLIQKTRLQTQYKTFSPETVLISDSHKVNINAGQKHTNGQYEPLYITIPKELDNCPTYKGTRIFNEYFIQITLIPDVSGCLCCGCGSYPKITLKLNILCQSYQNQQIDINQYIVNQQPIQYPVQNFQLNNQYQNYNQNHQGYQDANYSEFWNQQQENINLNQMNNNQQMMTNESQLYQDQGIQQKLI